LRLAHPERRSCALGCLGTLRERQRRGMQLLGLLLELRRLLL
jgi:hypothetical protein